MLHGHGNDLHRQSHQVIADFSSNIVPGFTPTALINHLKAKINIVANYPSPDAALLQHTIAEQERMPTNQIIVTNGATEAFYLIAHIFHRSRSLVITPSFAEYEDACRCHNHKLTFLAAEHFHSGIASKYDNIWIGNPNNPDGRIWSNDQIYNLCINHPHTNIIVDEAYITLCKDILPLTKSPLVPENLIIIRSLTKTFAIPGLRLGYLIASPEKCTQINNIRMPWSVNALAQEAGMYIMEHYRELLPDISGILEESEHMQDALKKVSGLTVTPSKCNFFLVKLQTSSAHELKEFLLKQHGFLIRDASNFRDLTQKHFRLAAQEPKYNQTLISAIQLWMFKH